MKKNYFMLAAATMMLAACAETDLVNEIAVEETPQAIGFDAFANKTTRAEMTDETIKNVGFKVWGYKQHENDNEYTVFDGIEVSWHQATNEVAAHWGYSNTKYWDETATYNFYAVAPNDNKSSISNGKITIQNVASNISTSSADYVIDRAGNTNVDGSTKATVEFDFNHIMAKLSFILKAGVAADITVTSLKMSGWENNTATFTQTEATTPSDNTHTEWTWSNNNSVPGTITLVGESATSQNVQLNSDMSTTSSVMDAYIMVPQTISYVAADPASSVEETGLTFTISYKIGDEVFTDQVGVVNSNQTWGTDTHTTYTITVAPEAIEFEVNSVNGFTDADNTGTATIE